MHQFEPFGVHRSASQIIGMLSKYLRPPGDGNLACAPSARSARRLLRLPIQHRPEGVAGSGESAAARPAIPCALGKAVTQRYSELEAEEARQHSPNVSLNRVFIGTVLTALIGSVPVDYSSHLMFRPSLG